MLKLLFSILIGFSYSNDPNLKFSNACERGQKITISAVGDLLLHGPLQAQAFEKRSGFMSLWEQAIPYFKEADIAYANLEGTVARNLQCNGKLASSERNYVGADCREKYTSVYTSYPMFNYHPQLIDDLIDSDIDIVSTANNHSIDRYSKGIDLTIEALEDVRLPFFGTRERENQSRPFYTFTESKGIKIAWIACTYETNGFKDKYNQVLYCFRDNSVENLVTSLKGHADAIIVTPHWGNEYKTSPNQRQKRYAKKWLDAGATAIIGSHPHVLQPWEKYVTKDGRETMVIYSLGNFVSSQSGFEKRATIIFFLGLTKRNGKTWINGVRYVPAYMRNWTDEHFLRVDGLMDLNDTKDRVLSYIGNMLGYERRLTRGQRVRTNYECY